MPRRLDDKEKMARQALFDHLSNLAGDRRPKKWLEAVIRTYFNSAAERGPIFLEEKINRVLAGEFDTWRLKDDFFCKGRIRITSTTVQVWPEERNRDSKICRELRAKAEEGRLIAS